MWRSWAVTQKWLHCPLRVYLGLLMAERPVLLLKRSGMLCSQWKPLLCLESMASDNLDVNIFPLKGEKTVWPFSKCREKNYAECGSLTSGIFMIIFKDKINDFLLSKVHNNLCQDKNYNITRMRNKIYYGGIRKQILISMIFLSLIIQPSNYPSVIRFREPGPCLAHWKTVKTLLVIKWDILIFKLKF